MMMRLLRPFLRPYAKPLMAVLLLQLVQTLAALCLPALNAAIIDDGIVKGDTGYIVRIGAVMLVVSLAQLAGLVGAAYFGVRIAVGLGRDVRVALFDRVQELSGRELSRFGVPSLIVRTTNDVHQVQMFVMTTLTTAMFAPIMAVGAVLMALSQSVTLSALLLLIVPILGVVIAALIMRTRPLVMRMQAHGDKLGQILREQITGVRVVRAFVREEHERARFHRTSVDLYKAALGSSRTMSLMFPIVITVVNFAAIVVIWLGGRLISDGSMQVGGLAAFLIYLMQVLLAVMTTTFVLVMLPRAELSAMRVQQVLETATSVTPPAEPVTKPLAPWRLEVNGVGFRYPEAEGPMLEGVSLVAEPGQVVAIIGGTGSGKSTLLNLIPRLIDVTSGRISIGGVDVRDLNASTLSQVVGYVPQQPYLFSGTVASNLRYGNPDATDDELWHALEVAQARDFVERMSEGLDTPVAQGGTTLSGGQRQRLAIARTLVHRPGIYLFDDSFSALDYATDAALRTALAAELTRATVVIVAQRVSTIRDADRIVILDQGRVVGSGCHQELMTTNDVYREIVLSQSSEPKPTA